MALSIMDIRRIINSSKSVTPIDDFRILDSWAEYEDNQSKRIEDRCLDYLCYKLQVKNPQTGEKQIVYKAIKLVKVVRVPNSMKQSEAFMDMHSQILAAVYERQMNFLTVVANIIEPVTIGLLFLYGIQGVSDNIETAKDIASDGFNGLIAAIQGTYKVMEMEIPKQEESEWLREKMFSMDYITAVRGIPKASNGGVDISKKAVDGRTANPDGQGTLEEFILGMADHEYILEIISTPVYKSTLEAWSLKTESDMTEWYSQMQGSTGLSFNISIPMVYQSSQSSSSGWSESYTDADSVSYSTGTSQSVGTSESVGQTLSQTFGRTVSNSVSSSVSNTHTVSTGHSFSETVSNSQGTTIGSSIGTSQGSTLSTGENHSLGHSSNSSQSFSNSQGLSTTDGKTIGETLSENSSISKTEGESTNHSTSISNGHSFGTSQSTSRTESSGTSQTDSTSSSMSHTTGKSHSTGGSSSTANSSNQSDGYSYGGSSGSTTTTGNSYGHTFNNTVSSSTNSGTSHTDNNSKTNTVTGSVNGSIGIEGFANIGVGGSTGQSTSNGSSDGTSEGNGLSVSDSSGTNWSNSSSTGTTHTTNSNTTTSTSYGTTISKGTSFSNGTTTSDSTTEGKSHSTGTTYSFSNGKSWGSNESYSNTNGSSEGWGTSISTSNTTGTGTSHSESTSSSTSNSSTQTEGTSFGNGTSESTGTSQSQSSSVTQTVSNTQSVSNTTSNGYSSGTSTSEGYSKGTTEGISKGVSDSTSNGVSNSTSTGKSSSTGTTQSQGTTKSIGQALGTTGAYATSAGGSMGIGPSIGYNKTYQWLDQQVKDILELLEYQNERLKSALGKGNGAFYTYTYIACSNTNALSAAKTLAKSTWTNTNALINPIQVLNLTSEEQSHLLYHFAAFSSDITREKVAGLSEYKYATILLPSEFTALTHPPRVSEGGIYAEVNDVPKFTVPKTKGQIYMGTILSAERFTMRNGYRTQFEYRIEESQLMHGYFQGQSRSGKTVAAMRFVSELSKVKRKATGKRLRVFALDPKRDWRSLARYIEPERFNFYSLGDVSFHPLKFNPCKIPYGVQPQRWIDGLIDIFCRSYGLLERGKQMLADIFYKLYKEAGVFDCLKEEDWQIKTRERSTQVNFRAIYREMKAKKDAFDDPSGKLGRIGNDTRDAYARLLDRLQCFDREFSVESQLFASAEGVSIDEIIGADDITVIESTGLETTFSSFIFGVISSGLYKFATASELGYMADDQYETVLVIEEANKVLTGSDTCGTGGGANFGMTGQSEFEEMLDQAAGYGLYIFAITQKIADMPSSIIANAGLVFAGRTKRDTDINTVMYCIGKEPRIEDRDIFKFMPKMQTGWFICQTGRTFNYKDSEPVLVNIAPLNQRKMTNDELDGILARKMAMATLVN